MFHRSAQSLIESVVSIGIVIVAVVAILSMGVAHTVLGSQSSERTTAANLAREGLEIVNIVFISKQLDPTSSWPYGLTNGTWIVDYENTETSTHVADSSVISECSNCFLCQNSFSNVYSHVDNCVGVFRRLVVIEDGGDLGGNCDPVNGCQKKVVSKVYWQERGRDHTLDLEMRLTDWR